MSDQNSSLPANLPPPSEIPGLYRKHNMRPIQGIMLTIKSDCGCLFGILGIDRFGRQAVESEDSLSIGYRLGLRGQQRLSVLDGFDNANFMPTLDIREFYDYGQACWNACVEAGMVQP